MKLLNRLAAIGLSFGALAHGIDQAALEKLDLPGIKINGKERYVDVAGSICLESGALELIACTFDTKEHESLVLVKAKPSHIHLALLLIGAKNGSPAMRRPVGEGEDKRWVYVMASGQPIEVSLVIPGEDGKQVVKPISEFIQRIEEHDVFTQNQNEAEEDRSFPTSTFMFLGSHLMANGEGPRRYLADESGNVISVATFGDEVLGLSQEYSHENGSLTWEIDTTHLPALDTAVRLRFKPVFGK